MKLVTNILVAWFLLSILFCWLWVCIPRRPSESELRTRDDGTLGRASDSPRRLGSDSTNQGSDHPYPPDLSGGLYSEWDGSLYGWFFTFLTNTLILLWVPILVGIAAFLMARGN